VRDLTLAAITSALILVLSGGCSGTISNQVVADPTAAPAGIRYYQPQQVELALYWMKFLGENKGYSIQRIGDHLVQTIPDTDHMREVSYNGALFDSKTFTFTCKRALLTKLDLTAPPTPLRLPLLLSMP
jgi:hypothetical protein